MNWFDTPYYHTLYSDRNRKEAIGFLDNLLGVFRPSLKSYFLDLACGRGRHALYLASKGYFVHGVDSASTSIDTARQQSEKLKYRNNVHFQVHDFRQTYGQTFDYVLNMFTSFGYYDKDEDNMRVLHTIKTCLKPNAMFCIDYLNIKKAISNLVETETVTKKNIIFNIKRAVTNSSIQKTIEVLDDNKTYTFRENVRRYDLDNFIQMFDKVGLKIDMVFGDYMLSDFSEEHSNRLILIGTRK